MCQSYFARTQKYYTITRHMLMNNYVFLISTSTLAKAKYSEILQAFAFAFLRHTRLSLQESIIVSNHTFSDICFPHLHILMGPFSMLITDIAQIGWKKSR